MRPFDEERYSEVRSQYRFDELLLGSIEESWARCGPIWRKKGRIEDKPFGVKVPMYSPWWGKMLAVEFASKHHEEYPFLLRLLTSSDSFEELASVELLGCMVRFFKPVPDEMLSVQHPLPIKLKEEIESERMFRDCSITTVGDYLSLIGK